MFENFEDIYYKIAHEIINATPDGWERAYLDAFIYKVDEVISIGGNYYLNGVESFLDINAIDGEYVSSEAHTAFFELYKGMKKNKNDVPWNKCRFELMSDGSLDVKFKLDLDFEWYKSLDPDGEDFDNLHYQTVDSIKSWEGLAERF